MIMVLTSNFDDLGLVLASKITSSKVHAKEIIALMMAMIMIIKMLAILGVLRFTLVTLWHH